MSNSNYNSGVSTIEIDSNSTSVCGKIISNTNNMFDPTAIAQVSTIYDSLNVVSSISGNSGVINSTYNSSAIIGDTSTNKLKLFVVEPWQSRKPLKIKDGLFVSLEEDMISDSEIKYGIIEKLTEDYPEIFIKMGLNAENIKLVRKDVTLEINMG